MCESGKVKCFGLLEIRGHFCKKLFKMNLAVMFINSKWDYYAKPERISLCSQALPDSASPASRSVTSPEDLPETPENMSFQFKNLSKYKQGKILIIVHYIL